MIKIKQTKKMMADSQQTTGFICNIGLKGLTVILPQFKEHKVENGYHKSEHTVFSPTVSCSTTQWSPWGRSYSCAT